MANSHGRKIAIREIVKSLLIQEGSFTEHKMMQYMDIALRGLKEFLMMFQKILSMRLF